MDHRTTKTRQQTTSYSAVREVPPSTPPSSRLSTRPLPPWPVSPSLSLSSPRSPKTNSSNNTPVCPGAPMKNRYPRSRFDDNDESSGDDCADEALLRRRGGRPRRLDFGETEDAIRRTTTNEHEHEHENKQRNENREVYPILRMGKSSSSSLPSPRASPQNCRLLGLRPHRQSSIPSTTPSMGVVPAHPSYLTTRKRTGDVNSSTSTSTTITTHSTTTPPQRGSNFGNILPREGRGGTTSSNSEWQR